MGDPQTAGGADWLDLPDDPRRPRGLHVVAPQSVERLHKPAWRIDLEVLALGDVDRTRDRRSVGRAGRPVRAGLDSKTVLGSHLGVGYGLPQALGRGLDVGLEHGHRSTTVDHCVFVHHSSSSSRLMLLIVAASGSAYLLTHRS